MEKNTFKKINNYADLKNAFNVIDSAYHPPLSKRIENYNEYIMKLSVYGTNYLYLYNRKIAGLVCFYDNNIDEKNIYISQISIVKSLQGNKLGYRIIEFVEHLGKENNMKYIRLEVKKDNTNAIKFYQRCGFIFDKIESQTSYFMKKPISY